MYNVIHSPVGESGQQIGEGPQTKDPLRKGALEIRHVVSLLEALYRKIVQRTFESHLSEYDFDVSLECALKTAG